MIGTEHIATCELMMTLLGIISPPGWLPMERSNGYPKEFVATTLETITEQFPVWSRVTDALLARESGKSLALLCSALRWGARIGSAGWQGIKGRRQPLRRVKPAQQLVD